MTPAKFLLVEGLLNFHTETLRSLHDVRVALPRRRSSGARGRSSATAPGAATRPTRCWPSSTRRQADAEEFIVPQRRYADIVVAFAANRSDDPAHLDADVILRDSLPHPDLSPLLDGTDNGPALIKREREWLSAFRATSIRRMPRSSRRRSGSG